MANTLFWSNRALDEYKKLVDYLIGEWGNEIANRVISEIDKKLDHIENFPEHFPVFKKRSKVRRCVASPQTSIFFKINKDVIEVYAVFDNRQNPKKRKL